MKHYISDPFIALCRSVLARSLQNTARPQPLVGDERAHNNHCGQRRAICVGEISDVIQVVSVSSDTDVIPCDPKLVSLVPVDLLSEGDVLMRSPCDVLRFNYQCENLSRYESSTHTMLCNKGMMHQQRNLSLLRDGVTKNPEGILAHGCLARAPTWTEQPGAIEGDGRAHRISKPSMDYESDRGINQVGLVTTVTASTSAFTGKKVDDLRSWYRRKYTLQEVRSEVPNMFVR